ncbi:MAG: recombinase family protein, partial [Chthonomonadaceae bacterium]|nr:recombinase family protein [Chthonomonadaceae bacterium]
GRFTHVCAYRGDRIYRNHLGAIGLYTDLLRPNGVKLIYVAEDWDESLGGQLVVGVLATVAEHQRRQIGENIARTLEYRRSNGYYMGAVPFGWRRETLEEKKNPRLNIVPVPEEREVVIRIKDWYLSGMSEQAIAQKLNAEGVPQKRGLGNWQATTVGGVLQNMTHAGLCKKTKDGPPCPGLHFEQRFYDEADYVRIIERTTRNRKRFKGVSATQPFRLFAGLVFCGGCGRALQSSFYTDSPCYRCLGNAASGERSHVYVSAMGLETTVVCHLEQIAREPEARLESERQIELIVRGQNHELRAEAKALRTAIDALESQASNLTEAVKFGAISNERARASFDDLDAKDKELRTRLKGVCDNLAASDSRASIIRAANKALDNFPALWGSMTDAERRECLHSMVERIDAFAEPGRKWLSVKLVTQEEPVIVPMLRGVERYIRERPDGPAALTPREIAALYLASKGLDYNQIAVQFETRPSNTHTLLKRAREKLGAKTNMVAWTMVEPLVRDNLSQLPLFGKSKEPRRSKFRLRTTEFKVLEFVHKGESMESIADRTGQHVDRIRELLDRAVAKAGCSVVSEAWEKVEADPRLWPKTMENRGRIG